MTENQQIVDEATWQRLQRAATEALEHSYSPYSRFPVGAAALVDDGRVVTGANIENASYGPAAASSWPSCAWTGTGRC